MVKPLQSLTLPFLAIVLIALVGILVATAPPAGAQGGVPPVTNIELRNGPNSGEVIVSWDAVSQATHYRIGYVNMEVDYHLATASCTEEWIEAFVYVDVNARNIPVNNGRAEYTVRRLAPSARHAFTVLTSNNFVDTGGGGSVSSEFFWPPIGSRWEFLPGRDTLPSGITLPTGECTELTTSPGASDRPLSNAELARRVKPALVKIFATPSDGKTYSGTGFAVRSDGLVVTNRHVVDDASTVDVHMTAADGHRTNAHWAGAGPGHTGRPGGDTASGRANLPHAAAGRFRRRGSGRRYNRVGLSIEQFPGRRPHADPRHNFFDQPDFR